MKRKGIISIVLAVFLLLAPASPVLAGGLTVYGGKIETSVSPGNDYSYTMKVENTSDDPMDIGVEVKGYGISANRDFITLESEEDNSPYTARELLAVSPDNFHLEPGDSQVITVTAEIPSGIGDGGRYAIVFIHTTPSEGQMVATISAIAARVLLTIDGSNLIHNSEVTLLEETSGELEALVTVANNGNHHYKPHIQGALRKGDKILATASIDADWPMIPGYSRQFKLSFVGDELLPPDNYEVDIEGRDDSANLVAQHTSSFEVEKTYVPPPQPVSLTLTPGNASVLETKNGEISISFPQGAVIGEVEISLQRYPLEQVPAPPPDFNLTTTCFRIDGLAGLLLKEATVTVKYTVADLESAEGDASRLRLARWDEANNEWSVLKTEVDSQAMTLSTSTNQLSIWAVMVATAGAPPTAVPAEVNWLLICSIVAGIVIIALLVYFLAVKRRRGY